MLCRVSSLLLLVGTAIAQDPSPNQIQREVGSRSVIVDFSVDDSLKATKTDIVSSEVAGLNVWATSLIHAGMLKPGSPGVTKLSDGRYRAKISFPVKDDGPPLPIGTTLPVARIQTPAQYPYEMAKSDTAGGVLLKLAIDKNAVVQKIELVRSSHPLFASAVTEAVKKWRFKKPALADGTPIDVVLYQLIVFNIEGKLTAPWEWQIVPEPALPVFTITGSYFR
jgi:TonB family protein